MYMTNHSNVERALLTKENVQLTVRLLLMNAFEHSDPELTKLFLELYSECPSLFKMWLPRSEVESLVPDDEEVLIRGDETHLRPIAIGCIQPQYVRGVLKLPCREKDMDAAFETDLRIAYS